MVLRRTGRRFHNHMDHLMNDVSDRMEIECFDHLPEDVLAQWQVFLATAIHQHPRQDPRFAAIERSEGRKVVHVTGRRNGVLHAVGLWSLRLHPWVPGGAAEAFCLSGPVCDDPADLIGFLQAIRHHPAFARVGRLRITPYWLDAAAEQLAADLGADGWTVFEPEPFRRTGLVSLDGCIEEILGHFSKSARREVRRAERQGVTLRQVTQETEALAFLESLNRLRVSRGLQALREESFVTAFRTLWREGKTGVLINAQHEDRFIAGLQLYRSRDFAHGRHFTSEPEILRELGNLRIAPIVWLRGMAWAKTAGCRWLDVEGYRHGADREDPKYNIYKYKSEFTPVPAIRVAERAIRPSPLVDMIANAPDNGRRLVRRLVGGMKAYKVFSNARKSV